MVKETAKMNQSIISKRMVSFNRKPVPDEFKNKMQFQHRFSMKPISGNEPKYLLPKLPGRSNAVVLARDQARCMDSNKKCVRPSVPQSTPHDLCVIIVKV